VSLRLLDAAGCMRFRLWRLVGELGLVYKQATLWLSGETLTLACADTPLSQSIVSYRPDRRHFRRVAEPRWFETPYRSPPPILQERVVARRGRLASRPSGAGGCAVTVTAPAPGMRNLGAAGAIVCAVTL
jgi:hypothetical protein